MFSNPSAKAATASMTTSPTKGVGVRKARTGKKAPSISKNLPKNLPNGFQADDTSRRVVIIILVILYVCGAFAFCFQVFLSPWKLHGLANIQQNHVGIFPQASTVTKATTTTTMLTTSGPNNRFQLNPTTIQSLEGMTDQQIRDTLGSEVQIQIQDQHGRVIHTTAKVDVQTTTSTTATINHQDNHQNDVTVNFDMYEGVAAYHCHTATTIGQAQDNDVVLLNAGRYLSPDHFNQTLRMNISKDQYREKVFLDLCLRGRGIVSSITALDVSSAMSPQRLLSILQKLHQRHRIHRLPVSALITPGPSSDVIVDWLRYVDDIQILQNRIAERWIPVSSESVLELEDEEDESFADEITENASAPLRKGALELLRGWPVLAVYGSDDILSRQGAELLERDIQAKTISLKGGDDCHEQAPDKFAVAVMEYLSEEIKSSPRPSATTNNNADNGRRFTFSIQLATL
jgi:hypothetical protein